MSFNVESTLIANLPATTPGIKKTAAISRDGNMIAYVSLDQSGQQVFLLQNVASGQITKINAPPGAFSLGLPVFSKDGSQLFFVADFGSESKTFLYSYDLQQKDINLLSRDDFSPISISTTGYAHDHYSVSADGRYLVFVTKEDMPALGDINKLEDVYLKDLQTGKFSLVSSDSLGIAGNDKSFVPRISNDGNSVMFQSLATNLSNLATDHIDHLYVKNMLTGSVQLVDVNSQGKSIGVSPYADVVFSGNGQYVVFENQDFGYTNGVSHAATYMRDLKQNSSSAINRYWPIQMETVVPLEISDNGRYLTFLSSSDTNGRFPDGTYDYAGNLYRVDFNNKTIQFLSPHVNRKPYSTSLMFYGQSEDFQTLLVGTKTPSLFGAFPEIYRGQSIKSDYSLYITQMYGLENKQGDDALYGSSGAEQFAGGSGNDTYWINHVDDVIIEYANQGQDTALSVIANYTLPNHVENLVLGASDAYSSAIPYGIGGTGNDMNNRITGNEDSNIIKGMGGDDVIDGGSAKMRTIWHYSSIDKIDGGDGFDIVIYPHIAYSARNVRKIEGGFEVLRNNDPFRGNDLLQNVERIQFNDLALALPGDTHAAQAYRIYQAAFNRTPDSVGLGFWVKQIDNGATLTDVARGFMQSAEFKSMYGERPSNGDMVTKFYQNVLHRAPDTGGLAFWTDVLDSGRGTSEYVLAQFAESPENQAALIGVIDAGFTFTLVK